MEKRKKETLLFSETESLMHTLKYRSSHTDFTGLEAALMSKSDQLFSALSEQTILYTSSYLICKTSAVHCKEISLKTSGL